jgi:hypothetical protein
MLSMQRQCWAALKATKEESMAQQLKDVQNSLSTHV